MSSRDRWAQADPGGPLGGGCGWWKELGFGEEPHSQDGGRVALGCPLPDPLICTGESRPASRALESQSSTKFLTSKCGSWGPLRPPHLWEWCVERADSWLCPQTQHLGACVPHAPADAWAPVTEILAQGLRLTRRRCQQSPGRGPTVEASLWLTAPPRLIFPL